MWVRPNEAQPPPVPPLGAAEVHDLPARHSEPGQSNSTARPAGGAISELERLAKMRDAGDITQDEFESLKVRLIEDLS